MDLAQGSTDDHPSEAATGEKGHADAMLFRIWIYRRDGRLDVFEAVGITQTRLHLADQAPIGSIPATETVNPFFAIGQNLLGLGFYLLQGWLVRGGALMNAKYLRAY